MKSLFFLLIITLICNTLCSQEYHAKELTVDNGLPSSKVYTCFRDSKGYIWISSKNGVCRWDSKHFEYFTIKDGLVNNEVLAIFEDTKGRIWFSAFSNELCYYYKGRIYNKHTDKRLTKINATFSTNMVEHDGHLYFQNAKNRAERMSIESLAVESQDIIANAMNGFVFDNKLIESQYVADSLYGEERVRAIKKLFKHYGYISIKPNLAKDHLDAVVDHRYGVTDLMNVKGYYHLKELDDILFYSSDRNLMVFKSPIVARQVEGSIQRLYIDKSTVHYLNDENEVYSVSQNKKSAKLKGFSSIYNINHSSSNQFLTTNCAIYNLSNGFSKLKNVPNSAIKYSSYDADHNNLYIGAANGLYVLHKKILRRLTKKRTYSILKDSKNRIWYSTLNSLFYCRGDGDTIVNEMKVTLDSNINVFVNELKEDLLGNIIIATNNGVYIYNANLQYNCHIDDQNYLTSNECNRIEVDPADGSLWISTFNGLNHVLYQRSGDSFKVKLVNRFFEDDGLYSNEINDILIGKDTVFVATSKGLNLIHAKNHKPKNRNIPIYIKKLQINNQVRKIDESRLELGSDENNLTIDFSAIYFQRRARLAVKYRLIKDGDTTENFVEDTKLQFLALRDGDYRFELYAYDQDYPYIKSELESFKFMIKPPFYKATWFWSIISAGLIGLIAVVFYVRMSRRKTKLIEEAEIQSKINEHNLKSLQNQMNPHFVFNSLNTMQQLMTSHQDEEALNYLSDFSSLMRDMLEQSRNDQIYLIDEIAFLKKYIALEKIRFENQFQVEWQVNLAEEELALTKIPCMLLQPIVENAIKHGISPEENEEGKISIEIDLVNKSLLQFRIKNTRFKIRKNPTRGNNMAIKVIRERLDIYEKNGLKGSFDLITAEKQAVATIKIPI